MVLGIDVAGFCETVVGEGGGPEVGVRGTGMGMGVAKGVSHM